MNPLAQRILDEIHRGTLSVEDQQAIAQALRNGQVAARAGHASPTARWESAPEFLTALCEWASELPEEKLPPRIREAATYFGCSQRTIGRWLERAHLDGWEVGFLRYWALANRGL